ncbi:conserved hypothetical protein [Talaromyces stipitatus ATCC 10500]|uniref:UBL3-like ubiquitin domain-containing protein n=1 Tax=Talaromyces stipitatus (strain ATCC 10500 / CBS 375.48 / QM 6759 / NRRL 1006) TaxID=441959 RepID=B8M1N8_TALSN|nr:uncharacterized protein TSTA_093710 [Talaromyces stipitatus ATCC 10500]EED22125.1 conserved hypothetical protein [Talaromyces stipitatus ATCC 10500]
MASNDGNVAALEAKVDKNNHDNVETSVATSSAAAVFEPNTSENAPSSSIDPVAETATAQKDTQVDSVADTENQAKEKKDTEIENNSSSSATTAAPAVESTEEIPAATVIATASAPTQPLASSSKPEVPETVKTTEEGESSDPAQPPKETTEAEETGPELVITLLLTTGARHPFRIDRKYLKRRSVKVENDDPFNMSVYTLKELIWREWRSEWEPQPSSPSSIRLISFGKLLDDKAPLSESSLTHDAPNVIHMTVKPQEVVDEEDAKGGKSYSARDREATDRSPGCRCIIL